MSTRFLHQHFGECEFVRVEGVDWIIRVGSTGELYRIPPARRFEFTQVPNSQDSDNVGTQQASAQFHIAPVISPERPPFEGVKGLLWAIRSTPPPVRGDRDQDREAINSPNPVVPHRNDNENADGGSQAVNGTSTTYTNAHKGTPSEFPGCDDGLGPQRLQIGSSDRLSERRRLRRVFESLRNGLSPINIELRPFAVGIDNIQTKAKLLLEDVSQEGGKAVVFRGAYGQGKTFSLQLLKQIALEAGFVVASTEIDAYENQLDKPHSVYRSLMRSLAFPDPIVGGPLGLAVRTRQELTNRLGIGDDHAYAIAAKRLLLSESECKPLAWILSDPHLALKPDLLGLLGCEPGSRVAKARKENVIPAAPNDWPSFSAGTQGDFASYLLSGIGRLTRFLGYKGLILVMDEMEKWQDLNWQAQSRAGNLLGGLIWASSAEVGSRYCRKGQIKTVWSAHCQHSSMLDHSGRCGGYPFSTASRCSLGLAIAMTPRGECGPESEWLSYGKFEVVDLPEFSISELEAYMQRVFPLYQDAYDVSGELTTIMLKKASFIWLARGDLSTRAAVQTILKVLDEWRESPHQS